MGSCLSCFSSSRHDESGECSDPLLDERSKEVRRAAADAALKRAGRMLPSSSRRPLQKEGSRVAASASIHGEGMRWSAG